MPVEERGAVNTPPAQDMFNQVFLSWVDQCYWRDEFSTMLDAILAHIVAVRRGYEAENQAVIDSVNAFIVAAHPYNPAPLNPQYIQFMWVWLTNLAVNHEPTWSSLLFGILQCRRRDEPVYQKLAALSPFPPGVVMTVRIFEGSSVQKGHGIQMHELAKELGWPTEGLLGQDFLIFVPANALNMFRAVPVRKLKNKGYTHHTMKRHQE